MRLMPSQGRCSATDRKYCIYYPRKAVSRYLNPFYSPMLEAAMQEGTRRNYSLFVTTSQDIHLPNGDIYIKKHMDGCDFSGEVDIRVIEEFRKQSIPVVSVNNYLDMDGLVCISADHYGGAVQATEYLCRLGHCKIGLLSGRFSPQVSEARIEGFVKLLLSMIFPLMIVLLLILSRRWKMARKS